MCESKVFLIDGEKKEKLMDEAILIKEEDNKLMIIGLLGEKKEIENAKIVKMDMDRHEIFIGRITK